MVVKSNTSNGVILFHKNAENLYLKKWIEKCLCSISSQTLSEFKVYEIDYGGDGARLYPNSVFYSQEKSNYAEAMNFIISEAFNDGCDYIFNTNIDDFYSPFRIEKQLPFLMAGYDIVSSDFCYIDENDEITRKMNIKAYGDVRANLIRGHNVIAHPAVSMSRKFWRNADNRYDPLKIPSEDLDLWARSIQNGYKFYICDEVLLYYRIHSNQIGRRKTE